MKNTIKTAPIHPDNFTKFNEALDYHMQKHGDNAVKLLGEIIISGENFTPTTITAWRRGDKSPRSIKSFEILNRIERHYDLPQGYFKQRLPHASRAGVGHKLANIHDSIRRRMAWHLPDDFAQRSQSEKAEILEWIQTVIISGSTNYRQYQAEAIKHPYSIKFSSAMDLARGRRHEASKLRKPRKGSIEASDPLRQEMIDLIKFKTSPLTPLGYERHGVWTTPTAHQMLNHIGLFFGALTASPSVQLRGLGMPVEQLSLGLLAFPTVWDWYLQWRKERRGFYTIWEVNMLRFGVAIMNIEAGWLRQNPHLAKNLKPINGLLTESDILAAQNDWSGQCDLAYRYFRNRSKEVKKLSRVHRDTFEPILPILEAESPLKEYLKIAEEVLRYLPDEKKYPKPYAEAIRSFLMLRIGLHSGLRQKNLRQLLFCPRDGKHSSEKTLNDKKCGELRWNVKNEIWEIFIPAIAFKNADSSFFGTKPYRLVLPDLGGLYKYIDSYVDIHRQRLLGYAKDPKTFFVKTAKVTSMNAAYSQAAFYDVWRATIQKYGVYNPYTNRGAIKGLLPHGPHNIRDVLATHVLKATGSFEQASYAIQDTPEMIQKHYGRFLPQDKSALAAKILNQVWDEAP